jgi:hypothetical protein
VGVGSSTLLGPEESAVQSQLAGGVGVVVLVLPSSEVSLCGVEGVGGVVV